MEGCVFCNISCGEIKTDFIFQDKELISFNDINPSAPIHILIVSRKHLISVKDLSDKDTDLIGKMVLKARDIARERNLDGYKLVFNVGRAGGQIVDHLHLHLLSGKGARIP
ncbi:MAG: HIT domain-containing protein [Candidatus Niyogibacteria bacterium]|nr:HIT domain-containing protein [Candidatus Niyogibacteria bacterium]